jgi:hypothetical protein
MDLDMYAELLELVNHPLSPRMECCKEKALLQALCMAADIQVAGNSGVFPCLLPTPGITATRLLWDLLRANLWDRPGLADFHSDILLFALVLSTLDPPTAFEECEFDAAAASHAVARSIAQAIKNDSVLSSKTWAMLVSCCGSSLLDVFGVDVFKLHLNDYRGVRLLCAPVHWFNTRALLPLAQCIALLGVSFRMVGGIWTPLNKSFSLLLGDAPEWKADALSAAWRSSPRQPSYEYYSTIQWLPALFPGNAIAPLVSGADIEYTPEKVDVVTAAVFDAVNETRG